MDDPRERPVDVVCTCRWNDASRPPPPTSWPHECPKHADTWRALMEKGNDAGTGFDDQGIPN